MEKKKSNTKKKSVAATKKTTTKKVSAKKTTTTKKAVPKKTPAKKTVAKKAPAKKIDTKKVVEEKVETKVTPKEEVLEKTYVFNKEEKIDLSEAVKKLNQTQEPSYENIGKLDKENKSIILGLTVAIALIVIGCLIYVVVNINKQNTLEENYIDDSKYKNIEYNVDKEEKDSSSKSFKDADYSNLINTNIDDFEVKVAEGKNMLVLISSDTCFYCVTFEPILNEVLVANNTKAIRLNISRMNNEETKRLRNYYAFKAAPTLLNIKKGEVITDYEGAMDKAALENWYDANVN